MENSGLCAGVSEMVSCQKPIIFMLHYVAALKGQSECYQMVGSRSVILACFARGCTAIPVVLQHHTSVRLWFLLIIGA